MVKIRFKRMGSKFKPFYRIVAADAKAPRDGKYIEEVGFYNPHSKETNINLTKLDKWLNDGAVMSETVKNLVKKYKSDDLSKKIASVEKTHADDLVIKVVKGKKKKVKASPVVEAVEEVAATPDAETPAE